ncbi:MAG: hypothetical protein AAF462_08610 [Thermodesulfobacteriota bacterium]
MDYSIILEWQNKHVPKEVVFKGINQAFEKEKQKGSSSLRNLKRCQEYVEDSIKEYSPIIKNELKRAIDADQNLDHIVNRISSYIESSDQDKLKSYYTNLKEKFISNRSDTTENIVSLVSQIEKECNQYLFESLSEDEQSEIMTEAKSMIGNRTRHMTQAAIQESTASFRDEIMAGKFGIKSVLGDDNG